MNEETGIFNYFIKVVPTVYRKSRGQLLLWLLLLLLAWAPLQLRTLLLPPRDSGTCRACCGPLGLQECFTRAGRSSYLHKLNRGDCGVQARPLSPINIV